MRGPETANPSIRAVSPNPNGVLPMPRSSDMGPTKTPKLPMPMDMVKPPATLRAETTIQP